MTQRPEILLYLVVIAATALAITKVIDGGDWLGLVGGMVGGAATVAPSAIRRTRTPRATDQPEQLEAGRWTR